MASNDALAATLIEHVRVFDGAGIGVPTSVLVVDGRIAAVDPALNGRGSGAGEIIDGAGGVLLSGLIDAHVHLHDLENLEQFARAGVTTALDMACWPRERVDGLRNRRGLTDIRSAGIPATSPGSNHSKMPERPEAALVAGPQDAERFVADRIAEGSDYIKLIADIPGPDQATLNALVVAAHARGMQVVVHAAGTGPYQMGLAAHADVLTHVPLNAVLDDASLEQMTQRSMVAVPTLTMMSAVADRFFGPEPANGSAGPGYHHARQSVGLLHRAGVPILAGTDANATAGAPAAVAHGDSLHRELELLVDAGLSPAEALAAATVLPARHFGLTDRGAVAVGLRADLLLLAGDPLVDISQTRQIDKVWCAGVQYEN